MNLNENIKDRFAYAMSEFLKENYGKSAELLEDVVAREPGHKLALVTRGVARLKLSHPAEAVEDFNRAIEIDPAYARAYHLRGTAQELLGNEAAALSDFSKAIELNPSYGAAFYSRAALFSKLGREDHAVEDIQSVTHLTNRTIESFANQNNLWRSQQLRLESMLESEMER